MDGLREFVGKVLDAQENTDFSVRGFKVAKLWGGNIIKVGVTPF